MKTLKERQKGLDFENYPEESHAYYEGYKDAIEGIFNDIINSQVTSVESIEKYLQDLLNK